MKVYVLTSICRNYGDASANVDVVLFDMKEKAKVRKDEWYEQDKNQEGARVEDYDDNKYRITGTNEDGDEYIIEVDIKEQEVE